MTSPSPQSPKTPPRILVRSFWALHRALYRISAGRIGLTRPKPCKRFGMLRLNMTGRRSGEPRVAIVGYFPDGPNLVTLAMNGWADGEPAWWLNLQAAPDVTVDLVDGPLSVRARVASGPERDRLWSLAHDYPGWGSDIDALASRRSIETAVVVLEPSDSIGDRFHGSTSNGTEPRGRRQQP